MWQYVTLPIPAFSQWLTLGPLPLINADFTNLAPVREAMRLFGFVNERTIGIDVVSVPFDFNVYTYLAEQFRDFGIVGAMIMAFLLGALSSVLERKVPTASVVGVRATLYAYLSFSLFADMAFFIVGWWLTLFMVVIVVPFGARFVSRAHS
jgi:oligosaccharide repeat unit polymerase